MFFMADLQCPYSAFLNCSNVIFFFNFAYVVVFQVTKPVCVFGNHNFIKPIIGITRFLLSILKSTPQKT